MGQLWHPLLGQSLANAFQAHYEQIWINGCPDEFELVYNMWTYPDLFRSPHDLEKLNEYLNTKHKIY